MQENLIKALNQLCNSFSISQWSRKVNACNYSKQFRAFTWSIAIKAYKTFQLKARLRHKRICLQLAINSFRCFAQWMEMRWDANLENFSHGQNISSSTCLARVVNEKKFRSPKTFSHSSLCSLGGLFCGRHETLAKLISCREYQTRY